MAALLKFGTASGVLTTAEIIARLNAAAEATLCRQVRGRPKLACHWQVDAAGHLFCRWDTEASDIPCPQAGPSPGAPRPRRPAFLLITREGGK